MSGNLPNDPAAALREVARRLESGCGAEFSGDHVFTVNTGGLADECRRVADEAERKRDALRDENAALTEALRKKDQGAIDELSAHGATLKKLHAAEAEADALRKASQDRLVCSGCGSSWIDGVMAVIDGKSACCPDCSTMSVAERNCLREGFAKRAALAPAPVPPGLNPEQLPPYVLAKMPKGSRLLESEEEQTAFAREPGYKTDLLWCDMRGWTNGFCGCNAHWTYATTRPRGWWRKEGGAR